MYIIDALWILIKEFLLDFKTTHKKKLCYCLHDLNGMYGEVYTRWTHLHHIPKNTTEIILNEFAYAGRIIPAPDLPLTSIMYNGIYRGIWCGYGWEKKKFYLQIW